jgi:hypothetical protein
MEFKGVRELETLTFKDIKSLNKGFIFSFLLKLKTNHQAYVQSE